MIRRGSIFSFAWALLLALSSPVAAQNVATMVADLGAGAEIVVAGRVMHLESRWDAGAIYEYVTVHVTTQLKGTPTPSTLIVKQLGGRVATVGLHIEGQAAFAVGEDVLLFLAVRPRDHTLYTGRLELGKWLVVPDLSSGRPRALPPSTRGASLAGPAAATGGLDLEEVRALVASTPVQGVAFVSAPAEIALAAPAYAYLPTDGGPPARWHKADDGEPVEVVFQTPPSGLPGGGQTQLSNALGRWNGGGTRLQLQLGASGPVSAPCNYDDPDDGNIRVYFNDPCGEFGDGDSSFFGVGGGFYTTGDRRTINGQDFQAFTQGYAILNNTGPHLASAACLQDALTHTIGHAIGLGDSNATGAIMRTTLPCSAANLGQDDLNGLRSIYPAVASGPNPPAAPTAFSGTVSLSTVTLQWTPATSGGPADTYILEAGSAPGLSNLAVFSVNAPATTTVVGNVPTGVYYVRVRARNIIATSGPSPEAVITVGPCSLPGRPQGFSANVDDTLVGLTWGAPASGGAVQGYTLAVGSAPGLANLLVQPLPASPTAFGGVVAYGDYYARLFARNTCGTGPATADILVRVQPCSAAPNAPGGLQFTRNGNQVSFAWTPPATGPALTRYIFVVGSASGGADLVVLPTPNAMPAFSAVGPSGTYFVRVLAQNACGNSGPSNEVQVVIP